MDIDDPLAACGLGDGKVAFSAEGPDGLSVSFRLDLVDWQTWHARWKAPEAADGFAFLESVISRVKAVTGVDINPGQADALLHAITVELETIRGKREQQLTMLRSTAST